MNGLEIKAKTVEEAIELALEQLGLSREEVAITVVQEGKAGILGIGSEDAMVKVTPLSQINSEMDNTIEVTRSVTEEILKLMGVSAAVEIGQPVSEETTGATLNVIGEDLGILIGRRGQTLASLQQIVRLITSHKLKTWAPLNIDIEGYRQRRYATLKGLALRLAERARETGETVTLEPMPANERRIVHLTLASSPDIITQSVGEGEERKVTISLRED